MKESQGCSSVPTTGSLERAARFLSHWDSLWCWLKPACRFCCWSCGILSIAGMLLVMRSAERVTLLAVANYAPPIFWLIPCGILIPLAVLVRGYSLVPLLSAISLWWLVFAGWEPSGGVRKSGGQSEVLTLMTYNRGQAQGHSLQPFLAETRPDLVALQDARGKPGYYRTHPAYGVYHEVRDEGEFVLLSQHPVLGQTRLTASGFPPADKGEVFYGVRWEIDWQGRLISLYSIHFPSPRRQLGRMGLRSLVPDMANWMRGTASEADGYWQWRERMAGELAHLLQKETLPWIMVGDLNTPPRGLAYARLVEVGSDLHTECGSGFGFTFPGDTRNPLALGQPWLRLDYVFADPASWQGKWLQPEAGALSQHRPLAAGLVLRGAIK